MVMGKTSRWWVGVVAYKVEVDEARWSSVVSDGLGSGRWR